MAAYDIPDVGGGTASYPGDPADYSAGGGGFNWTSFADSLAGAIPGILGGSANLYNAVNNHGVGQPYVGANGQLVYPGQYPPPQQPVRNNTVLYIVVVVVILLLLLAVAFFATRK